MLLSVLGSKNPGQNFGNDYKSAVSFLKKHKSLFEKTAQQFSTDKNIAMAIAFPELIRYNIFKDFFETGALELAYVNGVTSVDFSIGTLQMKPSFAEQVESYIKAHKIDSMAFICDYGNASGNAERQIRVQRLKQNLWQIIYLNAFIKIAHHKFSELEKLDKTGQLEFLATAYNHGFSQNFSEIQKWKNVKCFPYGLNEKPDNQYCYAEVASYFYVNDIKKLAP